MNDVIFEVIDKTERKIRLTGRQWKHIKQDHPEIENEEIIEDVIKSPVKITQPYNGDKHYYYKYCKDRETSDKYLLVIVKYLNGHGFIITAFHVNYIR